MIKLSTIASGSSGNSSIIASGNLHIMADCGISKKKALEGLYLLGISSLDAILLTHSHIDHIKSVEKLALEFDIPIFTSSETAKHFTIDNSYINIVDDKKVFTLGDMKITPFSTMHDSVGSLGFTFKTNDDKASLLTDTGIVTEEMFSHLKGSTSIILESNYDEKMLEEGPYPYFLKERIKGQKGHLSNVYSAKISEKLLESGTKNFILAHLSDKNNDPDIAFNCTNDVLSKKGLSYTLKIAKRSALTTL